MLHVGKRALKTVLALLVSLFIFIGLIGLNNLLGFHEIPSAYVTSREFWYVPTNWYTPFFAGIAAIYAMSADIATSIRQANIRNIGSVVGGYWGYVVVVLFTALFPEAVKGTVGYYVPLFICTAVGVIPLMKLIQGLRIPQAGFITSLTYMAVTVSIRNGGMGPLLFTTNRVLSTIIGVSISVYINSYPHFGKRSKDTLFISAIDGALTDEKGNIHPQCLHRLSDFIHHGVKFTYVTSDAVTHLQAALKDVEIREPVIVMDGAAVYVPEDGYTAICSIEKEAEYAVRNILERHSLNPFSYVFNENHLFGYYEKIGSDAERLYYNDHSQELTPMVKASVPEDLQVSKMTAVVKDEDAEAIAEELRSIEGIAVYINPCAVVKGYGCIDITEVHASAVNALEKLGMDYRKLVVLGGTEGDAELMKKADHSICLASAPEAVKQAASQVLPGKHPVDLLKEVARMYFKAE